MTVPTSDSREIRFFAEFPDDGLYVVETDLCKRFGGNCVAQKYISIRASSNQKH